MADRVLCITWERAAHGREGKALEVFDEAMGILGRMQQDGRIEKFDVALFNPNKELGGCLMIQGSAEQMTALHEDPEFQRNTVDAELCVNGITHLDGYVGEGIAAQMELYRGRVAEVPQTA
jgi:hypothetical protein